MGVKPFAPLAALAGTLVYFLLSPTLITLGAFAVAGLLFVATALIEREKTTELDDLRAELKKIRSDVNGLSVAKGFR